MAKEHLRPGKTHDLDNALAHGRAIAVNRALAAGWFGCPKLAPCYPGHRIFVQLLTLRTKSVCNVWGLMMMAAVESDHGSYRCTLSLNAPVLLLLC